MKKYISNKVVLFALGIIFVIGLWFLISLLFDKNGVIFPSPILTFKQFGILLTERYTYSCLGYTFLRMILGFLISFIAALILGTFAGNHQILYDFLKPLIVFIKSVPTVALVFLFIVLIAPKDAPIFIVSIVCFPIIYESVVGGIKHVDKSIIESAQVDGGNYLKTTLYIKLPLAVPYIVVGMLSSFALAFKIEIMAEVITGATKNGLGSVIHYVQSEDPTNMVTIFAYALFAIIIMLIVSLLETIITKRLKKQILL